jgi:predicted RND superfamily exporter protein
MEKFSYRFFKILFSRPWLNVLIILGLTVFFAFQLPRTELDNNNIRFIPENDEARMTSKYIDDTFGSSLFVLVGLERKYGTMFDRDFLNLIREYSNRIEEIPITGNINSIISSDYIYGEGDSIIVRKLVDDTFTGTPEEISELKRRILSWDIYSRSLISDDFSATQILVPLEISAEDAGRPEVIDSFIQIRDIAQEMFAGKAEVYVTGLPVISATINEAVRADLILLIPLVILVVLGILFFSFRRITAVVLPLLTVLIAVIWCIGAMPIFGVKLSVVSTVLPVILVAVGSAYGIHVVTHYMEDHSLKPELSAEEHLDLVIRLSIRIGKAVFLAFMTTFAGFFSFSITTVLPIREFGFFSSFGVLSAYIIAVTLIPSLLIMRGPSLCKKQIPEKPTVSGDNSEKVPDTAPDGIAEFFTPVTRHRKTILVFIILVTIASVYGVFRIPIDNAFVEYFRASTDISKSDTFIREKFGGSKIVSVVAQAETPEILLSPESLKAMDDLSMYLENKVPETGKTLGFTHLIKRINQVYNVNASPLGISNNADSGSTADFSTNDSGFGDFGFGDFGFGDSGSNDFGFGDFGFGDFGVDDYDYFDDSSAYSGSSGNSEADLPLSIHDLMNLLTQAQGSGRDRNMTANDLVREIEKLVNYEGASYYEIPYIPERYAKRSPEELQRMISGYLLLLAGSISTYANDPLEPTAIQTTVQLRTVGETDTQAAVSEIRKFIDANFPENIKTVIGGTALVESSLNRLVVQSQISSVFTSILLVFIILTISYRSLIAGFIGIAPLSVSILMNFAIMGFLRIKLNIGTSMVAAVSVGIGIDYTIHFIEAFKREYRAFGGKGAFLKRVYATSGKAIFINAASVGAGFAVLLFFFFFMLAYLWLLIAVTMFTSAMASLTVIPVVLLLIKPKFISKEMEHE